MQKQQLAYNHCRPGYYAREWRRKTGALRRIRLSDLPRTGPLLPIEEMPTQLAPVVHLSREEVSQLVDDSPNLHSQKIEAYGPPLPVDAEGRSYLSTTNPYEDTVDLAESLILSYYHLQGVYPAVIVLSSFRYLLRKEDYFIIGKHCIPYIHNGYASFDVIVRSA